MKIFYYNAYDHKHVAADVAIEADRETAARVFAGIVDPRSFFGIILPNDRVLQIYIERGGKSSLEILDRKTLSRETTYVTTPMAEVAIEAAFASNDVRKAMDQFLLRWTVEKLR